MKQKIEWYKEVLELEPGSRVFFPLAKLLAADGQTSDAVHTLQQGLLRHPDHVEARLLLVELLHLQHADGDLATEIEGLGKLFASYPGFWKAWSELLAQSPALHDAALAMRFFAAALQGKNVSWGAIIEQGLSSLLGTGESLGGALVADVSRHSVHEAAALHEDRDADTAAHEKPSSLAAEPAGEPEAIVVFPEEAQGADEEESEEVFSLRTRSMAEVLAEQGDLSGALDIYQELMQNADAEEKISLEARAAELAQRMGAGPGQGASEERAPAPGGESSRLVNLLESLAQRLEDRAR